MGLGQAMRCTVLRRLNLFLLLLFTSQYGFAASNVEPIPLSYFGLHIHRADRGTAWPNVPFGSWRLWDAYVTWADLQPELDKWEFSRLDRYVVLAQSNNVELILPLANTPRWAAARPNESSAYALGNASEAKNIEDWRRYIKVVAKRYKGRIRIYEIWNEPNIRHHYSGSIDKLVELTCEASRILKLIDPLNRVVSPGASAGSKDHVLYLDKFLAAGGAACVDVVGHHFYVPTAGPEAMLPLIRQVRAVMLKNSVQNKPLWNTETGWWIANGDGAPDHPMVAKGGWKKLSLDSDSLNYVERALLLARAEGVERFFWYAWDNPYGLGMIESNSGMPKPMVDKWRRSVDLLVGASQLECSQSDKVWRCTFLAQSGVGHQISWTAE